MRPSAGGLDAHAPQLDPPRHSRQGGHASRIGDGRESIEPLVGDRRPEVAGALGLDQAGGDTGAGDWPAVGAADRQATDLLRFEQEPVDLLGLILADQVHDSQPMPRPVGPDRAGRVEVPRAGWRRGVPGGTGRPGRSSSAPNRHRAVTRRPGRKDHLGAGDRVGLTIDRFTGDRLAVLAQERHGQLRRLPRSSAIRPSAFTTGRPGRSSGCPAR